MPGRAAIIISCSKDEADTLRYQARQQHRTMSGYILNILLRAVEFEEMALERWGRPEIPRLISSKRTPGARTTVLLRCSSKEARRIRAAGEKERGDRQWVCAPRHQTLLENCGDGARRPLHLGFSGFVAWLPISPVHVAFTLDAYSAKPNTCQSGRPVIRNQRALSRWLPAAYSNSSRPIARMSNRLPL
jgi:hypothetical protein